MEGALEALARNFRVSAPGAPRPTCSTPFMVDAYGSMHALDQVGTVAAPEPRLLTVQVWDDGLVKHVEKAIRDVGPRPQSRNPTAN